MSIIEAPTSHRDVNVAAEERKLVRKLVTVSWMTVDRSSSRRRDARNLFHSVKYLNEKSKFRLEGNFGYFATARRQSQQYDRGNVLSEQVPSTRHFSVSFYAVYFN